MRNLIKNVNLILPDRIIRDAWLVTEDDRIDDFGRMPVPAGNFTDIIDGNGLYLSPGFVETHVHGGRKHDFTDATAESALEIMRLHLLGGTATILPTMTSVTHEKYIRSMENLNSLIPQFRTMDDVPEFGGIHMEGPYCSGEALGAQNTLTYRDPDFNEIEQYVALAPYIRKWTAAPEREGGMAFGRYCEKHGILASIGHSGATLSQVYQAWDNGYRSITHLYSACSSYHRNGAYREAGIVEAAWLIDDMDVEMITDGVHLPKEFLQLIYKIKGPDRISMITDAIRYAGVDVPEGSFVPYEDGQDSGVWIENGVALVPSRACFAGSIATFDRLVRTATKIAGIDLVDVIRMSTLTPARTVGLDKEIGSISRGKRANLLMFDDDISIKHIILRGKMVR